MKKILLMFMTGLIFLNVLTANNVSAQSIKAIRAEVPFDFHVGDKVFPAGDYRLESISRQNDNIFQLRSADRKSQRLLATTGILASGRETPKLIFYRIGDRYYLTNIFMEDGNRGFSLRLSRRLREGGRLASTRIVEVPVTN